MATATQQISPLRRVGLVMTHNQRETCIEAINSLLKQTLVLDLIIVSDDRSTDGTYGVITDHFSKNGKPSNVELYQSEKNLGFIPHFNTLLKNHCREDDLIFYNAGDDISETSRVEEFYREYVTKGKPRHFLGHSYVTSFGSGTEEILVPPIESIKENRELFLIASAYHIGASQVFTGALFFDFGPILFDDCYEDLTLGYRALLKNAYHFIPKALLRYRVGGLSSWQKNSLEKKRGRLKSTLTQRAVDSIRSGDFDALTTIQDCYSQYGFSLTPHSQQIRVTVIRNVSQDNGVSGHSISDHFRTLSNVCNAHWVTPKKFIGTNEENREFHQCSLVWIVLDNLSLTELEMILTTLRNTRSQRVVLDVGLPNITSTGLSSGGILQISKDFLSTFPYGFVHSSCIFTADAIRNETRSNRITFLPPLQNIDGPDPRPASSSLTTGLVVICDASAESMVSLNTLSGAFSANVSSDITLEAAGLNESVERSINTAKYSNLKLTDVADADRNIEKYHFTIIISGLRAENSSIVSYWWSRSAKYCVPVLLNAGTPISDYLIHGSTCLFVNGETSSWRAAVQIIQQQRSALTSIARNARRYAYFEQSIQKSVARVTNLLAQHTQTSHFFHRFLPL
jgi:hypothetical protein